MTPLDCWLYGAKFSKIILKAAPIGNNSRGKGPEEGKRGVWVSGQGAVTMGIVPATWVLIIGEPGIIRVVSD